MNNTLTVSQVIISFEYEERTRTPNYSIYAALIAKSAVKLSMVFVYFICDFVYILNFGNLSHQVFDLIVCTVS